MIRRPPRSTRVRSSAASDVYKRQVVTPVIRARRLHVAICPMSRSGKLKVRLFGQVANGGDAGPARGLFFALGGADMGFERECPIVSRPGQRAKLPDIVGFAIAQDRKCWVMGNRGVLEVDMMDAALDPVVSRRKRIRADHGLVA